MKCLVVWVYDGHRFVSDEMSRKMAQSLVDDLRKRYGIDAEIHGCGD